MSMHLLKRDDYTEYCSNVLGPPESFETWDQCLQAQASQFKLWTIRIELGPLLCRFVRSLCEGNFLLYVQVCDELCA